jgi:epsin
VVIYFKDNVYVIKTLKEFQYVDEEGKDQGANVRQKAKDITNLLSDESRLRQERRSRAHMRDRMIRGGDDDENGRESTPRSLDENSGRRKTRGKDRDEDELRKAIEESKRSLAAEQAKQGALTAEERDLMQAIKLSEEDELKRNKALADANENSLFDDQNQLYVTFTCAHFFTNRSSQANASFS